MQEGSGSVELEWRSLVGGRTRHIWNAPVSRALCGAGVFGKSANNRYRNAKWRASVDGDRDCKKCMREHRLRKPELVPRRSRAYRGVVRTEALYVTMSVQEIALLNTAAKRLGVRRTDLARAAIDAFCKQALSMRSKG